MKSHILGSIPAIDSWFRGEYADGRRKGNGESRRLRHGRQETPLRQNHGTDYRTVYNLSEPEDSVFIVSTRQSGNQMSLHYDDYAEG